MEITWYDSSRFTANYIDIYYNTDTEWNLITSMQENINQFDLVSPK